MKDEYQSLNVFLKYLVYLLSLYLIIILIRFSFSHINETKTAFNESIYNISTIEEKTNNYKIDIKYPIFESENINNINNKYLNDYMVKFKNSSKESDTLLNTLTITSELYQIGEIVNVLYIINDSFDLNNNYKSIFFDITNDKEAYISDIYSPKTLKQEIIDAVNMKYSLEIREKVLISNIEDFAFQLSNDGLKVYFNKNMFETISYTPTILLYKQNNTREIDTNKKLIAFTFDDGPGNYTIEMSSVLKSYNYRATFFMLGNKMKYNQEIVKTLYKDEMEIGSHTYAHKNLNKISESETLEEINSTTIIYNEITGDKISLLRPPYGNAKESVRNLIPYPIILWSIDTGDWLYRDSNHLVNHIMTYATDGDIILMHDVYSETLEGVKKVLPLLQENGFEVVTVSELAKFRKALLEPGKIFKQFKSYSLPF